jgi:hypothetical protein
MTKKTGRPIKIEQNEKKCTICKVLKAIENFALTPIPTNPTLRRNQCNECRSVQQKQRAKDQDIYKKRYREMSEEKKKKYIKTRSEQNSRRFKTNPDALSRKKAYDKTDKGIYNRYKGDSNRGNRLARNITLDLTFEQFQPLINAPCTYCGQESCRGVDRIDSSKPYTVENSIPCCFTCNRMKSEMSQEDFIQHLKQIISNFGKK